MCVAKLGRDKSLGAVFMVVSHVVFFVPRIRGVSKFVPKILVLFFVAKNLRIFFVASCGLDRKWS